MPTGLPLWEGRRLGFLRKDGRLFPDTDHLVYTVLLGIEKNYVARPTTVYNAKTSVDFLMPPNPPPGHCKWVGVDKWVSPCQTPVSV